MNENVVEAKNQLIKGNEFLNKNKFNEAIVHFTKAIEINPDSFEGYYKRSYARGLLLNSQQIFGSPNFSFELKEADILKIHKIIHSDLSKVIELNPNYCTAYYSRGLLNESLNDYYNAIQDFSKNLELDPNNLDLYLDRSRVKLLNNDILGSLEDIEMVLNKRSDDEVALTYRGLAKAKLNDFHGAIIDYTEAIKIDNRYSQAFYHRGLARHNLKQFHEAIEDFSRTIAYENGFIQAYYYRSEAKYFLENFEGAIEDCTKILKLDEKYLPAYTWRGEAKIKLKKYLSALEDFTIAINYDQTYALAYYNRGYLKKRLENYLGAIVDLEKAADLDQRFSFGLNDIYLEYELAAKPVISIGNKYKGGIIAYILEKEDHGYVEGEVHGLIISHKDLNFGTPINWYSKEYLNSKILMFNTLTTEQIECLKTENNHENKNIGLGFLNTERIVKQQGDGSYAASLCDNLLDGGYSDWFLPSIEELSQIFKYKNLIGNINNGPYWSSSYSNKLQVWQINFESGNLMLNNDINKKNLVRAVRYF